MTQDPKSDPIYAEVAQRLYQQLQPQLAKPTLMDYAAMPGQGIMETTHAIATGLGVGGGDAMTQELARRRPPGSDTLTGQVLTGAGSTVPFLASGGVGAAAEALGATTATGAALTTATVGGLGMAAEGGNGYLRAKAAGATEEQALAAGFLTAPGGLLEIVPTAKWAQRFGGVLGRLSAKEGGSLIRTMVQEGAENALQEFGQDYWANLIAKEIHSPEEAASLLEAAQSAPSSAIVGALFGAASHYYAAHTPAETPQVPVPQVTPTQVAPVVNTEAEDAAISRMTPEESKKWNEEAYRRGVERVIVPADVLEKRGLTRPEEYRQERARELMDKPISELRKLLTSVTFNEERELKEAHPERDDKWFANVADLRAKARDPFDPAGDRAALELKRLGIEPAAARPYHAEDVLNAIWAKEGANAVAAERAAQVYEETGSRHKAAIAGDEVRGGIVEEAKADDLIGLGPVYSPFGSPPADDEATLGTVIGRKMQGTLENTLPPGVQPVNKQQVMDSYLNVLRQAGSDSKMLQGGVPEQYAGTYHPLNNVVRETIWGDLATASHEIGHALERAVFGFDPAQSPWSGAAAAQKNVSAKMQGELYRLGKDLYKDVVPNGGYLREGFSEYTRLWLTNHDVLMQQAPEFTRWFETELLPKYPNVMEAMKAARESSDIYRAQGSHARADAQRVQENSLANRAAKAMKMARYLTSNQAWVNSQVFATKFDEHMEKRLGRPLGRTESVNEAVNASRLVSAAALKQLVEDGTTLDDGSTVTGASLKQVLAPIAGREEELFEVLYARTARARWDFRTQALDPNTGKPVQGVSVATPADPGISLADAEHILQTADPLVLEAAQGIHDWLQRVTDFIASVDPDLGNKLRTLGDAQDALHPGGWDNFWMPLRRWAEHFNDPLSSPRESTRGKSRRAEVTKQAKGSGLPVKDILPEMLKAVRERIEMAYMRVPVARMLDIADVYPEYAAPFIRVAGEEDVLATKEALAAAAKPLVDGGPVEGDIDTIGSLVSYLQAPVYNAMTRDPIIPFYRNGKMRYYEVDRTVYTGMLAMNQQQLRSSLAIILNKLKNFSVMTTTGLSPRFGAILNPMIDLPVFVLNTKYYANPVAALGTWLRYSTYSFMDGLSNGRFHKMMQDPAYEAYKKILLEYGQSYHVNSGRADVTANRLLRTRTANNLSPANMVDFVASIVSATEKAGRVSEMKGALKAIGWDFKSPLTPEQVMMARIAGKQVTVDYTQAGDIARQANQFIPFFNAPIQGTVAIARGAKHHPYRFAAYMAAFMALTMKLWDKNKDDEDYIELPIEQRARYWHFKVNVNGRPEFFRVKKPQEIAVITSIVEELADADYRKRGVKLGELASSTASLMLPGVSAPYMVEPLQLALNKDFRTGQNIMPQRLESLDAAGYAYEQTNEWITKAANFIGRTINVSPIKVDHFLNAYFSGLGQDVLNAVGLGADLGEREPTASDMLILGAAFKRGGPTTMQSQAFVDFYRALEIADGRSKSKEHPETPEQFRIRKMLEDAGAAINSIQYVRDNYLKTNKDRDAAMAEMRTMARKAADMAVAGIADPYVFEIQKNIASMKRQALDMKAGKIPFQGVLR